MATWMRTNIRSLIALIIPLTFVVFIGCGGGGDEKPPPAPPNAKGEDMAALQELQMKAVQMRQACVRSYAVVLMPALQKMSQGMPYGGPSQIANPMGGGMPPGYGNQIVGQQQLAGQPGMPMQAGMGMPGQAPPMQQDCYQAMMNFIMCAKTAMNGQAIAYPPFRQWVEDQFRGIGNRIAGVLASQGVDVVNNPQLRMAAMAMGQQVLQQYGPQMMQQLGGLPPGVQGMVSSAVNGMMR